MYWLFTENMQYSWQQHQEFTHERLACCQQVHQGPFDMNYSNLKVTVCLALAYSLIEK